MHKAAAPCHAAYLGASWRSRRPGQACCSPTSPHPTMPTSNLTGQLKLKALNRFQNNLCGPPATSVVDDHIHMTVLPQARGCQLLHVLMPVGGAAQGVMPCKRRQQRRREGFRGENV